MNLRKTTLGALCGLLAACAPASGGREPAESPGARALVEGLRAHFPQAGALTEANAAGLHKVDLSLPAEAAGAFRLADRGSGVAVAAALTGASAAPQERGGGLAVYRGALDGADLLYRAFPEGVEDSVYFARAPGREALTYEVSLSGQVAGLRLVANTLEFLDGRGTPRLRVAPPFLFDAAGAVLPATLSVEGCAVDSNPAAPWGRPPVAPGSRRCTVGVSWRGEGVVYPALLDPAWTNTLDMRAGRASHTATLLANGEVLLAGGQGLGGSPIGSAELYDPATRTFASTGSLALGRHLHTASLLPGGEVLVAGGQSLGGGELWECELYSPEAGSWSAAAQMVSWRMNHAATVMPDGQVFVTGGRKGTDLASTELFEPDGGPGGWSQKGDLAMARSSHAATLLPDGRVLITGGVTLSGIGLSAELFGSPADGGRLVAAMSTRRMRHTATLLANGKVLVAGGFDGVNYNSSVELFDPASGGWSSLAAIPTARSSHTANVLDGGAVLFAGGEVAGPASTASTVIFDPRDGGWTVASPLTRPVRFHTATSLPGGGVLVAGGVPNANTPPGEVFWLGHPGQSCTGGVECWSGRCVDGVCCTTACAGQCEACNVPGDAGTCVGVDGAPVGARQPCTSDGSACGGACIASSRACAYPAGATACRPASCNGSNATSAGYCDGAGACPPATTTACAPFICETGGCRTSCGGLAHCVAGYRCTSGACVPLDGGTDAGPEDAGPGDGGGAEDAGGGDAGEDAGADAGPGRGPRSVLGWSCGCSAAEVSPSAVLLALLAWAGRRRGRR